jgi:integrase/recombinase XerD
MTHSSKSISPLRQRFIDDMRLRKLKESTQRNYVHSVIKLTEFLQHSPQTATAEELRTFQLHMVDHGVSSCTINATITGLRFFFEVTLENYSAMRKMRGVHHPRKIPIILSLDEVKRVIEAASTLKYKAALSVAYGSGLRSSEVTHLKVNDIDSQNMLIHVEQGKGEKDRYAMLSPVLLGLLRRWWREAQQERLMFKDGWLFPGLNPVNPLSTRQLSRACAFAVKAAGIKKHIHMHSLRHAFATHQLERGVDIRVIQVLLGHKKLETTTLYSQVATQILREVTSPLDDLLLDIPT